MQECEAIYAGILPVGEESAVAFANLANLLSKIIFLTLVVMKNPPTFTLHYGHFVQSRKKNTKLYL